MSSIHFLRDEVAVVGWSCRVPGASSVDELWSLLLEGRCSVGTVPPGRWSLAQYGHPRRKERGKSYTWAAGIVDDVWRFDPTLFGVSPREAEQMDPQQRILLELTWEALEDAGIRPSSVAGSEVGVYVGGSSTDYANARWGDPAGSDSHFATGNALSILANRISYVFDLHGPSLTVDTACSSSLVALHQAVEALKAGRIDTAIVGGINVLASPYAFISFSQASMLSPTGLCRAFSAKADGYVRAEGGMVVVLRKATQARVDRNPIHGIILASDVNSDGRTNGISLPSGDAQERLLDRVYPRAEIDPNRLAFVEAHGTGTAVGDPTEAVAVGQILGRSRSEPLPIGSIKTNIGHLEPASGLAGVLKALLALNHGILPRSLHFDEPNPRIDFDGLNLSVCAQSLPLPNAAQQCAGINSFGFGGTNAHVVVGPGRPTRLAEDGQLNGSGFFSISAETHSALVQLAHKYAERLSGVSDEQASLVARAAAHRRDRRSIGLVIPATRQKDLVEALEAFATGEDDPRLIAGTALGQSLGVAFVYSGNGSQWVGMGIAAYRDDEEFRANFDQTDEIFKDLAGWSLREALYSETLAESLKLTSVAQPLIFAIQSAATATLRQRGLHPAVVLGHSVGEVAAAEAAGILDRRSAVEVIYSRSTHQELVRGNGRMAAVLCPLEAVDQLLKAVKDLSIAAINSPRAVTLAGPTAAISALRELTKRQRLVFRDLDLDYPFHTPAMAPVEAPLLSDLAKLAPREGSVPFVSTVTGAVLSGRRLDAAYWWQNVREPVQFEAALKQAVKLGARLFVEIGPRSTLLTHISDSVESEGGGNFAALSVLDRNEGSTEPFSKAVATCIIRGASINTAAVFGPDPGTIPALPTYPWQHNEFRNTLTPEAVGYLFEKEGHPLCGARLNSDALEWRGHLDTVVLPELADHRVGEQTILPGSAFLEIALAVARHWLHVPSVTVADFEILKPLDLTGGETREIQCRVSPGSNTLEILSRPRLTGAAWLLHARGKMLHANQRPVVEPPFRPGEGATVSGEAIYRLARMCGLHYGPAFRLVEGAMRPRPTAIGVTLKPTPASESESPFHLDPVRLDACFHGLFVLFPDLQAESRGVAYIPVRFDELSYYAVGGSAQRATIELRSCNERSVVADFHVYGADGELIAILRGAHFQAIPTRRTAGLESIAIIEQTQLLDGRPLHRSGVGVSAEKIIARMEAQKADDTAAPARADESFILEGWAMAMAYEIAAGFSGGEEFSPEVLVSGGRLPPEMLPWLRNILLSLEGAGLAKEGHGRWTLLNDPLLPSSASVLRALATEHPAQAAELLLAGEVSGLTVRLATDRRMSTPATLSHEALDYYAIAGSWAAEASKWLAQLMVRTEALWPADRALRILQVGFGPLTQTLVSMIESHNIQLTVLEPDRRRHERAKLALPGSSRIKIMDLQHNWETGEFDLIVSVESLHRLPSSVRLSKLHQVLAPRGMLIAVEPQPSLFRDLAFGLLRGWFDRSVSGFPVGSLLTAGAWKQSLEDAGFGNSGAAAVDLGSESALFIVAESAHSAPSSARAGSADAEGVTTLIIAGTSLPQREIATTLATLLPSGGVHVGMIIDESGRLNFPDLAADVVVQFLPVIDDHEAEPVQRLNSRCMEIKSCAEQIGSARTTLWIVFPGAWAAGTGKVDPVETGAWAFSRTLANEFPNLDIRRVDIAPHVPRQVAAERLRDLVLSDTAETELLVDNAGVRAVRVESIRQGLEGGPDDFAPAAQLQRRMMSNQRLHWRSIDRSLPLPDQVEIEVEATGLNFRDLMWMLSLLPEDMLEHGFTGPTLGLECAGRISHAGTNVKNLRVGDHVVALASSAFSTHVVVPAAVVAKVPDGLSSEDAATIPVAFLTAYYSLLRLARLRRGEWVLVHGGAGAVGMAAIQIAHWRGAKVIATAGSKAKRDLLKALGVAHVLDSRSTDFVDQVKTITREGVDVVLNSLAGEAMERGLSTLRPFGRFVELGKRDYVANTHVGLRPFRRNLTYFGVDLDNLIEAKKGVGHRIYRDVMRLFRDGVLTPLPHCVFPASEVIDAFHLMQQSGHIGKIVVRPPRPGTIRKPCASFSVDASRTHLITGAFGGFGLETARWLVDRGARHLVMLGRRGPATDEAKAVLSDFANRGVKVLVEAGDVADRRAVEKLFEKMHLRMPPVAGVIHAAMVLEDALIANLDADQLDRVLRPKVKGAENLDIATRGLSLDYFVLFSSVTTLIGNPGQGSYVAANGFMEGLARRRRQEGLPALAIGWGPISNVGVVAQNKKLQKSLQVRSGVRGLVAREALDLMAEAIEQTGDAPAMAVVTIASNEWTLAADRLRVLRSPTYAAVIRDDSTHGEGTVTTLDLRALVATEDQETVRRKVADRIVAELARVLHAREEDISRVRPLSEIGVDSLMALELNMNLKDAFGIEIPLSSSAGGLTVAGFAEEMIAQVNLDTLREEDAVVTTVAGRHIAGAIEAADVEALKRAQESDGQRPKRLLS